MRRGKSVFKVVRPDRWENAIDKLCYEGVSSTYSVALQEGPLDEVNK
jgi:hypothetical protein